MEQPHLSAPTADLISKDDLYAEASSLGLELQDDRLDRWRSAGLIADSTPISGTHKHGYTRQQADRIITVARIASEIRSERPAASEIAYRLAYEGDEAPSDLVLQHLEDSVHAFQNRTKQWLKSFGRGKLLNIDTSQPLARLIVRAILKRYSPPVAQDIFEDGAMLALDTMLAREQHGVPVVLVSLLTRVFRNATAEAPQVLWEIVRDFSAIVRLDSANAMLQAIKEVNSYERDVSNQAVTDTRLLLEIGGQVFPWMIEPQPFVTRGWLTQEDYEFLKRRFAPCMTAVLLTARHNAYTRKMLHDVRAGDASVPLGDFYTMKQASDQIVRAFVTDR